MLLARAGQDVMLLEQHTFPRAKPCGDCISPGANTILERLGLLDAVLDAAPARLNGWQLAAGGSARFGSDFGDNVVSLAIERSRFDAILLDAARAAGVEVHTSARVTDLIRTADGIRGVRASIGERARHIHAELTIGADGLRSRIARRLSAYQRLPEIRKVSLTAHVRGVPDVRTTGEMHVAAGMCLGIGPLEDSSDPLCNVTVVLQTASGEPEPAPGGTRRTRMMRNALSAFPHRDLSGLITDDVVVLASGPFDWPVRRTVYNGAVLVGDAAGYYDPFTGQGIYQAIAGAEMLAQQIVNGDLNGYAKRHRDLVAPARRVQRGIEFVCARPLLANAAFRALAHSPRTAKRLVQVTGDLRPARDLVWFK